MALSVPPNSGPGIRPPRILLVDDDPIVLRALRRLLRGVRAGWYVDVAESADAALQQLAAADYDVVVTDLHMPVLDGLQLLARLKAERPEVTRVIHSSHVESLELEQAASLAHAVLAKTGRAEELVGVVERALDARRHWVRDSAGF